MIDSFFLNVICSEYRDGDPCYQTFLKLIYSRRVDLLSANRNRVKNIIIEEIKNHFLSTVEPAPVVVPADEAFHLGEKTLEDFKIGELNVKNFCGFQSHDPIKFHNKFTLFFAENGRGKSSLCDALEYGITGDVMEMKNRKCAEGGYLQNKHQRTPPFRVDILDTEGRRFLEDQNYERCFLEKNRLENFGRLSQGNSSNIQKNLSDLLGFGPITDLIRNFVKPESFGPTDIEKQSYEPGFLKILNWKTINDNYSEEKIAIDSLLRDTVPETANDEAAVLAHGQKLKGELENRPVLFSEELSQNIRQMKVHLAEWLEHDKFLKEKINELNFKNLYKAAQNIFERDPTIPACPLCETSLSETKTNPISRTESELEKLKLISDRQESAKKIQESVYVLWGKVKKEYTSVNKNLEDPIRKQLLEVVTPPEIFQNLGVSLEELDEKYTDFTDFSEQFKNYFSFELENLNIIRTAIDGMGEGFEKKEEKRDVLRNWLLIREKIKVHANLKEKYEEWGGFGNSYLLFFDALRKKEDEIVERESSEIDSLILSFYQALNNNDTEAEKVIKIQLPKTQEEKLRINLFRNQDEEHNALELLSEGHLKTLGLSILLARAVKYKCPFLIFDDVVNAIDSEHRDNIIELLSSDADLLTQEIFGENKERVSGFLENLQLIVTTHDAFFDQKISNYFNPNEQIRHVLSYDNNGVLVSGHKTKHYNSRVSSAIVEGDLDFAVSICRKWFGLLIEKKVKKLKIPLTTEDFERKDMQTFSQKVYDHIKGEDKYRDEIKKLMKDLINSHQEDYSYHYPEFTWTWRILNQEVHGRLSEEDNIDITKTNVEKIQEALIKLEEPWEKEE